MLEHDPDHIDARVELARTLRKQGKLADAIAQMRSAFDRAGQPLDVAEELFWLLAEADDLQGAIDLLTLLDDDRSDPDALATVARLEIQLGRLDDAARDRQAPRRRARPPGHARDRRRAPRSARRRARRARLRHVRRAGSLAAVRGAPRGRSARPGPRDGPPRRADARSLAQPRTRPRRVRDRRARPARPPRQRARAQPRRLSARRRRSSGCATPRSTSAARASSRPAIPRPRQPGLAALPAGRHARPPRAARACRPVRAARAGDPRTPRRREPAAPSDAARPRRDAAPDARTSSAGSRPCER